MELETFLQRAWQRYVTLAPDASKVVKLLAERGDRMVNDHVAFRTFDLPGLGREACGRIFEAWGYKKVDDLLHFPDKKLLANYWLHEDPKLPKIFVSDLQVGAFGAELQSWIRSVARIQGPLTAESLLEPTWAPVKLADYERFYPMSEYAAWTAAFGIQVNHFTLLVNSSSSFASVGALNAYLQEHGIELNSAGGLVKGTAAELLEQSSTMAQRIPWAFADGVHKPIMGCYFEFAQRHTDPSTGKLFTGFLPKSADRIFESTFESGSKVSR